MGALSIAFDITIVGALALPWVALVAHLLFFEGENKLDELLKKINGKNQAVAGVILFAAAYTLGSAVSRMAVDFFNDDDLHAECHGWILRMGSTENHILTSVYCYGTYSHLLQAGQEDPALAAKIGTFASQMSPEFCRQSLNWIAKFEKDDKKTDDKTGEKKGDQKADEAEDRLNHTAADIFALQESALMLKGQDATLRLHQLHDQIMVLRGAAFNALLTCVFCLYGCGRKVRRDQPESNWRWPLMLFPVVIVLVGIGAFVNHTLERYGSDPPYMEFCLMGLGAVGCLLLWRPVVRKSDGAMPHEPGEAQPGGLPSGTAQVRSVSSKRCRGWLAFAVLSFVICWGAVLGWWSSEVVYARYLIYYYDSKDVTAQK